jgi:hypothetical protein
MMRYPRRREAGVENRARGAVEYFRKVVAVQARRYLDMALRWRALRIRDVGVA